SNQRILTMFKYATTLLFVALVGPMKAAQNPPATALGPQAGCEALLDLSNLTITRAVLRPASGGAPARSAAIFRLLAKKRGSSWLPEWDTAAEGRGQAKRIRSSRWLTGSK